MADTPKSSKKKSSKTKKVDPVHDVLALKIRIAEAALAVAADQGWQNTGLSDIARAAEISMRDLVAVVEDRTDILRLIGRMVDRKVAENVSLTPSVETSARDKLFDLFMDRYDVLNDYRHGIIAIVDGFKYDPKQVLVSLPHLCTSISLMLEMADVDTSGAMGAVRVTGMSAIYLKVLRVWVDDDSPDMAKTMAALDKHLERAEQVANTFRF